MLIKIIILIAYIYPIGKRSSLSSASYRGKKLQEAKEGFTILLYLNDINCEETCILMEYCVEELCESKNA